MSKKAELTEDQKAYLDDEDISFIRVKKGMLICSYEDFEIYIDKKGDVVRVGADTSTISLDESMVCTYYFDM